jgi:perosamine synthetase
MDPKRRYWHPVIGYNYRMTNIAAAIGLAQVEKADWHIQRRREVAGWYCDRLKRVPGLILQAEEEWVRHVYQFFTVVLGPEIPLTREEVIDQLLARGIEGRPVVYPSHTLPAYSDPALAGEFPVSEFIASRGINLPTWAALTKDDVRRVCDGLTECISQAHVGLHRDKGGAVASLV